ncbi:class I SAM-dependent methyltransferase [Candidatus Woesearchaeota archaeon]|nr:class I SAM-dependent methyltransferase [Candidatus Woesearchaeota archaeon]
MTDVLTSKWDQPWKLKNLDDQRRFFRDASSDLVRKVLLEHVAQRDTLLEIGSGFGELVGLVPEYEHRIQQTEQGEANVTEHRRQHPTSNILVANVYRLPFPDASFDVVLGNASFDTFGDLEAALTETKRVLRPNGRIIHFLDLTPDPCATVVAYQRAGYAPFPALDDKGNLYRGLRVIKHEDYLRALEQFRRFMEGHYLTTYLTEAEAYIRLIASPEHLHVLQKLAHIAAELEAPSEVVSFTDAFLTRFQTALDRTGFTIREDAYREGNGVLCRDHFPFEIPGNYHKATIQGITWGQDDLALERLGHNYVRVVCEQHVLVAQKV